MGEVRQEPSYLAIQYLHETKKYPISKLCAALHIPRCSYYKWLKREKNRNELLNEQIIDWIKALYIAQNGILGYRQMTIAINRTHQTQFLISMTDELWHIKLAPATITSWYLIRSMKQLRRILMHIL